MAKKYFLFALAFCLFLTGLTNAQKRRGFPVELSGELKGAPFRIAVPENWNGTLFVYAHGYRDKADHPGEVDNRNADIAPNGSRCSIIGPDTRRPPCGGSCSAA